MNVTNLDVEAKNEELKNGEGEKLSASRQGSVGSNEQFDKYTNEIYDGLLNLASGEHNSGYEDKQPRHTSSNLRSYNRVSN